MVAMYLVVKAPRCIIMMSCVNIFSLTKLNTTNACGMSIRVNDNTIANPENVTKDARIKKFVIRSTHPTAYVLCANIVMANARRLCATVASATWTISLTGQRQTVRLVSRSCPILVCVVENVSSTSTPTTSQVWTMDRNASAPDSQLLLLQPFRRPIALPHPPKGVISTPQKSHLSLHLPQHQIRTVDTMFSRCLCNIRSKRVMIFSKCQCFFKYI